jgi:hypothetical protein
MPAARIAGKAKPDTFRHAGRALRSACHSPGWPPSPRGANRGAPEPMPMPSKLNAEAAQLLSQLADGRLLSAEVNADLVEELHRDGYVRKLVSKWHVTPAGALALMEAAWR